MITPAKQTTAASATTFGGNVRTTNVDLVFSTLMALALPSLCAALFQRTGGALASLTLYYGVACVGLVWWRKGTLDYQWPARWPWLWFAGGLLVAGLITASNWGAFPHAGAAPLGVALTALIWAPLNGAMEQLAWLYVLDAWRNRWPGGWQRRVGVGVGWLLLLVLVTLIHIVFWSLLLPAKQSGEFGWIDRILTTLLTFVYVALYYRSRSMWPTFIVHTLVDLQLVLLANYSILPSL
jgi:hypothetical protein